MSFLNILVIHGYGTVYVLVVGLMAVFVILTLIQVLIIIVLSKKKRYLLLSCLGVHWVANADVFIALIVNAGMFSFLSYRDPNLLKTLDVYDGTGDFLRELEMDKDALTKAIIGTIGDVDSYQLPDAKGYSR